MHGGGGVGGGKRVFLVLMALQISLMLRLCEFNFHLREISAYPVKQGARCVAVTVRRTLPGAEGAAPSGRRRNNVTFPLNALPASPMAEK